MSVTCVSCEHFKVSHHDNHYGHCWRSAPLAVQFEDGSTNSNLPKVYRRDGCGDWTLKTAFHDLVKEAGDELADKAVNASTRDYFE